MSKTAQLTTQEKFESALKAAGVSLETNGVSALRPITELDVAHVTAVTRAHGLAFDEIKVLRRVVAALHAGKHLILQGAPGTGKTTLATALADAAYQRSINRGYVQVTGSSDWTPSDTVGTYRLNRGKELEFARGHVLDAIANGQWLILDELNRADIDRAMGPLFSVLSGHPTELRYEEEGDHGRSERVAIVPEGKGLAGHRNYEVHPNWRIVATMNTKDLDLLFEVSQAFLRRFAIISVPCPSVPDHRDLLRAHPTGDKATDSMVLALTTLPDLELGPAITIDAARYVQHHVKMVTSGARPSASDLADEVFEIFVRPQLPGYDETGRQRIRDHLRKAAGQVTAEEEAESSDVAPS